MEAKAIIEAVLIFDQEKTVQLVQAHLDQGTDALTILDQALIAAMDEVGRRFSVGVFFVPEMLMAAEAMRDGLEVLRPHLAGADIKAKGTIIIGTVMGDIHDIGKNLVAMMMEGAGFEVINIGINNPVESYLEALEREEADILGMSALLTTTMPYMKVVIDTMKSEGVRDNHIVMVGGAPLNDEFAEAIGADAYCRDAATAVETAKKLIGQRTQAA